MSNTPRLACLDGVRGLASLMVALSHFVLAFESTLFSGKASQSHFAAAVALSRTGLVFFYNPDLGVPIFFVLSGFVLANSMDSDQTSWPVIALRRWLRLCLPVLATSLLIDIAMQLGAFKCAIEASTITYSPWLSEIYGDGNLKISIFTNIQNVILTFFTGKTGEIGRLNPVLWTMPIELLGSLGLFTFYRIGAATFRRRSWGGLVVSLVLVVYFWKSSYQGFVCGIVLFEIYRAGRRLPLALQSGARWFTISCDVTALIVGIWLGSTPFIIAGTYMQFLKFCYRIGLYASNVDMHHFGAALLIAAVLFLRPLQRTLSSPLCRYFGRISFMLYLVQIPVLCTLGVAAFLSSSTLPYNSRVYLAFIVYLPSSIFMADCLTRLIDLPSIKLSHKLSSKIDSMKNGLIANLYKKVLS